MSIIKTALHTVQAPWISADDSLLVFNEPRRIARNVFKIFSPISIVRETLFFACFPADAVAEE